MKTDRELLKDANELIRSLNSVIERKGAETNWDGLESTTKAILAEQHKVLYPPERLVDLHKIGDKYFMVTAIQEEIEQSRYETLKNRPGMENAPSVFDECYIPKI